MRIKKVKIVIFQSAHPDESREPSPVVSICRAVWEMDPVSSVCEQTQARGEWRLYVRLNPANNLIDFRRHICLIAGSMS